MSRVEVKLPRLFADNRYDKRGKWWCSGVAATTGSLDLLRELELGGIDIGRDFTARVDHPGQVLIATQDLGAVS